MKRLLMSNAVVAICGLISLFAQCMSAQITVHVVGGGMGWTISPGGASAYSTSASTQKFAIGDILTFNFVRNAHDVVQVTKASYDSCNKDNAIGDPITEGPANVTLSTAGDLYFICSDGTHCQRGQKLAITVSASASGPAGDSLTAGGPTAVSSPQPPPWGLSSPAVLAAFLFSLLSVAVGFVFSM